MYISGARSNKPEEMQIRIVISNSWSALSWNYTLTKFDLQFLDNVCIILHYRTENSSLAWVLPDSHECWPLIWNQRLMLVISLRWDGVGIIQLMIEHPCLDSSTDT